MVRVCRNFLVVFLILIFNSLYGQSDQEKFLVAGKVMNSKTGETVPLAHIILNGKRKVTACDDWGGYRILLYPGESITVTAIGYKPTTYMLPDTICKDTYKEILLQPTSYKLEEVTVFNLGTWEQFKQDFIHMKIEPTKKQKVIANMKKAIAARVQYRLNDFDAPKANLARLSQPKGIISTTGLSTGIPVGRKYYTRSQLKINQLSKEYKYAKILAAKFNREIVSEITGEKDEERLNKLMAYISEKSTFTYQTKAFEILNEVKALYAKFIVLHPASENKFEQDTV